jgi:hypothetical protein
MVYVSKRPSQGTYWSRHYNCPPTYGMARCRLKGAALSTNKFDKSALKHGTKTLLQYEDIMSDLAYYVFPMRAIQVQKHYMQHYMQKLQTLKMEEYVA